MQPIQRLVVVTAGSVAMLSLSASPASAHGLGGRSDLPVPVAYFVWGAGLVLVLSFAVLAVAWPRPRLQEVRPERPIWSPVRRLGGAAAVVGLVAFLVVVVAGIVGRQQETLNPAPVLVFVWLWLAIPFLSALVGDVYPAFSPWPRLAKLTGVKAVPEREPTWGYVPAAVALVGFTWLELVSPINTPRLLAVLAVGYAVWVFVGYSQVGFETTRTTVDGFGLYNHLLGGIGPIGRNAAGEPIWRGWLRGLPQVAERRGLVLAVTVLIGTVTFDGLTQSPWWGTATEWLQDRLPAMSLSAFDILVGSVGMAACIALVFGAYLAACAMAARFGGGKWTASTVAMRFAHTLVPIALAYAFAHYFTLLLFEGQLLFSTMSDPFDLGWNVFGTKGDRISYSLIQNSAAWIWYVQLAAILAGHVTGVVLAHDRALADFDGHDAVRSQYAMLVLMLVLTGLGLVLLSAG